MPGVVFPHTITVPGQGQGELAFADWKMQFVVVLAARQNADYAPLKHTIWQVHANYRFTPGHLCP
jgi:hypothetical protein